MSQYFWVAVFQDGDEYYVAKGIFRHAKGSLAEREYEDLRESGDFFTYCRWKYRIPTRAKFVRIFVGRVLH